MEAIQMTNNLKKTWLLISIYALGMPLLLPGQGLVNKGSTVVISDETIFTVKGSLINDGRLINNGRIFVSQDWTNYNLYEQGDGEVILNGGEAQNLMSNEDPIFELTVEGSGEKILKDNLRISKTLSLTDGIILTSTSSKIILSDSCHILGGSQTSYVEGPLYNTGTGFKYYPIGKNKKFTPVELQDVKGINPTVGLEMFESQLTPMIGSEVTKISDTRYYQQSVLNGSFEGSIIKLKILEDESLFKNDRDNLVVAQASSVNGPFYNLQNSEITENSITSALPVSKSVISLGFYFKEKTVLVPNVFSLSAANLEDQVVKVYGRFLSQKDFLFRVYNRWGDVIFESTSLEEMSTNGWNGRNSKTGKNESIGVYKYTLKASFSDGEKINRVGSIMLME